MLTLYCFSGNILKSQFTLEVYFCSISMVEVVAVDLMVLSNWSGKKLATFLTDNANKVWAFSV